MAEPKYKISMNLQVLNHLGLNLYSSMPAVLSEVVANAWDADAENVKINIDNSKITIIDDGSGMNLEDINERFLKVGYRKRDERAFTSKYKRPVMGRKGIGKLSLFSIASIISILTNKDGEKNALLINTVELEEAIKNNIDYSPEEIEITKVDFENNGTKIVLEELRKRTFTLGKYLKCRLARRFSIIGNKYSFSVLVNNEEIKPEDRGYIQKAQYLWLYGDVTHCKQILSQVNTSIFKHNFTRGTEFIFNEKKYVFTGWLATSKEPNALKDNEETINRISIMIRGKMAKEDILSECGETGLYAKYVFGELNAEFLDVDNDEDIITSNRQNFFEDDERYQALFYFVKSELREIKNKWEDLRNQIGTEEASKIEVVKEWYEDLGSDDKKAASKLFGKINQLTIEQDDKKELIRHGILAFETLRLRDKVSEFENISPEDISTFIRATEVLNTIEATYYYNIVHERLSVIKKMKKVTDENALENVVQKLLAKHLWLLDPAWDRGTELPAVEEAIKKQFDTINSKLSREEKDSRLDVRYKKASNRHVIIELKRSKRTVNSTALYNQIRKYHSAMSKILDKMKDKDSFEIIVLVGKNIDGMDTHESTYEKIIKSFEVFDTRIMHYQELIVNAERMYSDFIKKNKRASNIYDKFIKV